MTTGSEETRKEDFVISKTPKTPPPAIRTNMMKFTAYKQNYKKKLYKIDAISKIYFSNYPYLTK
jgi:hypothetical protein